MAARKKATGSVMFIVGKVDFQYNDQTYYEVEGGGTSPVTVYRSKERAQAAADAASLEALGEWDLMSFGYDPSEVFTHVEAAQELFEEVGVTNLEDVNGCSEEFVAKMDDAQKRRLLKILRVEFYRVHEVEVGE